MGSLTMRFIPVIIAGTIAASACAHSRPMSATGAPAPRVEMDGRWRLLFDGSSLDAWRGYEQATVPDGWRVADGTITKDHSVGDIMTREQFGNFELELD